MACAPHDRRDLSVVAVSADVETDTDTKGAFLEEGTVNFSAIPIGIYYMKEKEDPRYRINTSTYPRLK